MVYVNTRVVIYSPVCMHITIIKGFSLLGFQLTPDVVEYATVDGLLKMDEIFRWATMIIEFYFGAQLAKGK